MNKANLSVFASGVGSNLLAIHNASKDKCFPGKLQLVICNKICPAFELFTLGFTTNVPTLVSFQLAKTARFTAAQEILGICSVGTVNFELELERTVCV